MATTNNAEWADRMRVMSLHGISKDAWKRYSAEGSWYYEIVAPGFKYNMTDIAAAMGIAQLRRVDEMMARRRVIAEQYTRAFAGLEAIELLRVRDAAEHAWHLFVIRLVDGVLSIDRNRFIEELKARGIGVSVHFIPLHLHPYYRAAFGYRDGQFPHADLASTQLISLPIYPQLSLENVDRVVGVVMDLVRLHRR
jgi:perosamine synthetase